jgi:putative adenylate-forming enzyme
MPVDDASRTNRAGGSALSPVDRELVWTLCGEMVSRESWPRERLVEYQRASLRETVGYAVANSPYYRRVIGHSAWEDGRLQELPVLTKTTLMERFDQIVTDQRLHLVDIEQHLTGEQAGALVLGEYRAFATGGTTGERGVVVYDRRAWEVTVGNMLRWMKAIGVGSQTRVLGIGAPTPLHITNRAFAELQAARPGAPCLAVTTPLPQIVESLNAYQPEVLFTYPSVIRRLAEEQHARRLWISPQRFCSTAETLTQDIRNLVRQTWGATVLNGYGTTEAGLIGTECEWNAGIHVAEDVLVFEVVDERDRPVPPGVAGHRVLVTTLFNRTLPLIRYALSDLVALAEGPCRCGRPHVRLATIEGRREDVLTLPARDGGQVSVHALRLREPLLRIAAIRQFQVTPHPTGLHIRVTLREIEHPEEVLQSIRRAVQAELDRMGSAVEILRVDAVDEIGRAGTGAKEKLVSQHRPPS